MYCANGQRYEEMQYNRCGKSGLKLPFLSLGMWHNFGAEDSFSRARDMILGSFDMGITHFDIANNYGPPAGTAEETFGKILKEDLRSYRDELLISTKAGYYMWPGPYGEFNSRKNLMASLDNSLKRLGLDYVDIFYSHRPDSETPVEETAAAMADIVKQGKALYVGVSNYYGEQNRKMIQELRRLGVPCLINQIPYSMFERQAEDGTLDDLQAEGVGAITFKSLHQGILSRRYFHGIPENSRAAGKSVFLLPEEVTAEKVDKAKKLDELAKERGQTLSQMAIAWAFRHPAVCSVLVGASRLQQIQDSMGAMSNLEFTREELDAIEAILAGN